MNYKNLFSQRLKELRLEKGLNQPQLAVAIGKPLQTLNHWENGLRTPPLETLMFLARYFDVSLDHLTGYDVVHGDEEAAAMEQAVI